MTTLDDLLARVPDDLRADLESEIARRARPQRNFGLVFERHDPEAVDLIGMDAAVGDTVRVLPPRGSGERADTALWRVREFAGGTARLVEVLPGGTAWDPDVQGREPRECEVDRGDIVPVAESTDTIYPGLQQVAYVEGGDTKDPVHTIIEGENLHAIQALTYTHAGTIDCIYIDPPYNTGAKDWKYNNDYVDGNDAYRHSKWLTFMERRLRVAKQLLNPDGSVLIVTIDEKEVHRLALLLEQTFPGARIQMVSSVISRRGTSRKHEFSRTDEYIFFVTLGSASPKPIHGDEYDSPVTWQNFRRDEDSSARAKGRPNQFYPIHVSPEMKIASIGEPYSGDVRDYKAPDGTTAVWPIRKDGTEMVWGTRRETLQEIYDLGFVRITEGTNGHQPYHLTNIRAAVKNVSEGKYKVVGYRDDGTAEVMSKGNQIPDTTHWDYKSHDAGTSGTSLIRDILGDKRFTYPKSLYAVEDALRFFVKDKPDATILDFFAGSGTTAHAVMRLNQEDGGRRRSISITNNEVSADEAKALTKRGLRPGDSEWDELGIAQHVTYPRVKAAITGKTAKSNYTAPIKGKYAYNREGDMSAGIAANAALFRLTYENPTLVEYDMAFDRIAPLLWLRAGQRGRVIDSDAVAGGWAVQGVYGVLTDPSRAREFIAAVRRDQVPLVYVVTDSDSLYRSVAAKVPRGTETVRLYESYLVNFRINDAVVE